jgi:hypothetical protein
MKIIAVDINGTPHHVGSGECISFDVLAKQSDERYLVLASGDGDLYDPVDINHKFNQRDRERGGYFWELRTCSKECYDRYTSFLRSKHRTSYVLAQRRFRNDFR